MATEQDFLQNQTWIDRESESQIKDRVESLSIANKELMLAKLLEWKANGIVIFSNVVDRDTIDAYLEEVETFRSNPSDYAISVEIQGKQTWSPELREVDLSRPGVKYNHMHCSSWHAARLSLSEQITQFLSLILESRPCPMQSLTFWHGSQQPAHIDYPYVRQQRRIPFMAASWIPLEDVHPDSGPLAYFPGAHKTEVSGFFDWGAGNILSEGLETQTRNGMDFALFIEQRMSQASIEEAVFLPKKGDVLIWHANMPHKGTSVANPGLTRKSYVTHYTGLDDYPRRWIKKHPESNRALGFEINHGTIFDFPWSNSKSKLPSWSLATEKQLEDVL